MMLVIIFWASTLPFFSWWVVGVNFAENIVMYRMWWWAGRGMGMIGWRGC